MPDPTEWPEVEQATDPPTAAPEVAARALVTKEWDHKGHRFVELNVLHLAADHPVARTIHIAIYRPRGA